MNKKDFPLAIHKDLNSLKSQYLENFISSDSKDPLMRFEDLDQTSTFFFEINSFKKHHGEFYYDISFKPNSENDLSTVTILLKFSDVEKKMNKWLEVIHKFDETQHFADDPLTQKYAEQFYEEYKLIDEDANEPFTLQQQLLIDKYLENVIIALTDLEESNNIDLEEPRQVASDLRSSLTNISKNEVVQRLSKLWGIAQKKGLPIIRKIFFELAKEVIVGLGKKWLGLSE